MANKNFAPSMTFTESEVRLPKRETPGVTRTGMLLTANSGYGNIPINIRTESQLADMFGYPTETNYKMWFDAAGYLKFASELYIVRPVDTAWTNNGISVTSGGVIAAETKKNMYNPDIAENTLDSATTTKKIEFYNKTISSKNDIAVAICSKKADWTSPVFDEDSYFLSGQTIYASTGALETAHPIVSALHGVAYLVGSGGTYKIYTADKITAPAAWTDTTATAITTAVLVFDENTKKFYTFTASTGLFVEIDEQPLTYTKVKDYGTNFISYVVPNFLGSSLYGTDKKPATFEQIIKVEPDFLKLECGVAVFKKDSQGYWQLAETYVGSFDESAKTTSGSSKYIKTLINKSSNYIYCVADPIEDGDNPNDYDFSTKDYMLIDAILYDNGETDYSDYSGFDTADLETAAEIFGKNGYMQPELLIAFDNGRSAGCLDTMPVIANETGFSTAIVSLYNLEASIGLSEATINQNIVDDIGNNRTDTSIGSLTEFNSYTMSFGQMKQFYDKYNDKYRWVPIAGDMAGLLTRNDLRYGVEKPLAGYVRGSYNNFAKLLSKGTYDQDELTKNGINQVVYDHDTQSYVLFEFITNTQLDLIVKEANIRRMIIYIKQFLKKTLKNNYFEFNNTVTRDITLFKINNVFAQLKKTGGLYDYLLICDETNNTAERINSNEFVLDVRLQPGRAIKYIIVNIVNFDTGLDITENE